MALVIVLLGTPSLSWCQEPPASVTFHTVKLGGRPSQTVTVTSDRVTAVLPAEAGKHPDLRTVLYSADWKQCAFVDNRDGRYRETPQYREDQLTPQLWIEIRWRLPGWGKKADTGEPVRFYPAPHVFMLDATDADAVNGFLEARKLLGQRCVDTPLKPLPQ
jgi:hypothetical protein